MIDFSKIKNSKGLKWALIIGLPTALVLTYYGYQYIKNKRAENKLNLNPDGTIDTTGMEYYKIIAPFNTEIAGKIYEAILDVGYVPVGSTVVDNNTVIELMTKSEYADKIKTILPIVGNNISIEKITKEQSLTLPKEYACSKDTVEEINNINDFYKKAECLEWKQMFGYDLMTLKDLPNIEKRITVEEMRNIYEYAKKGATKLNEEEANEFLKLITKAYRPI